MPLPEMQPGSGRESPKYYMEFQEPKELQGAGPSAENTGHLRAMDCGNWCQLRWHQ